MKSNEVEIGKFSESRKTGLKQCSHGQKPTVWHAFDLTVVILVLSGGGCKK